MNKSELIDAIAKDANITKVAAKAPKREGQKKKAAPKSAYQATKAKAHKATGHKGANSRRRKTSTTKRK